MGRYSQQRRRYPGAARKSTRAARREVRPAQRQANRDVARAQRQGQRAASSARRTYSRQAAYERNIAQNLPKGIATPGLVQNQLMQGAQQSARYGQGLAKLAGRAARQDVQDIQESVPSVRSVAAENLAALVAEKRAAEKEQEIAEKEEKAAMGAARSELRYLVSRIPPAELFRLHNRNQRDVVAKKLASTEGIELDPAGARAMVDELWRKLKPTVPKRWEGRWQQP